MHYTKMYSVRLTNNQYGKTNFYLSLGILLATATLNHYYGGSIWVIYLGSVAWHLFIESGLFLSGLRKGEVYFGTYKMPKGIEIVQRAMVEGPAFCVPAYLVSANGKIGDTSHLIIGALLVIIGSLYLAISDLLSIRRSPKENLIYTRRSMNAPGGMMVLGIVNMSLIFYIALNQSTWLYFVAYSIFVLIFYAIHLPLGIRFIEFGADTSTTYHRPNFGWQCLGLFYDSTFEMTLFIAPAYLIPWSFGWLS